MWSSPYFPWSDTPIAKNYLDEKQIRQLERAVTGYFDYIEDLIERENVFAMEEFSKSVNAVSYTHLKCMPYEPPQNVSIRYT